MIDPSAIPEHIFERKQWILTQLRLAGTSLTQLAKDNRLHLQSLSLALTNPHGRGEEVIATALGTTASVLFKERFSANGARIFGRRDRKSLAVIASLSTRRRAAVGQKAKTA